MIKGGGGTDVAVFGSNRAANTITRLGANKFQVTNEDSGETDVVKRVESLQFADKTVKLADLART